MLKQTFIIITLLFSMSHCRNNETRTIGNEKLSIVLAVNNQGVQFIEKVISSSGKTVFFQDSTSGKAFETRLENSFLFEKATIHPGSGWKISYRIYDVDAQTEQTVHGNEFELSLKPGQLSAIFFISETSIPVTSTNMDER